KVIKWSVPILFIGIIGFAVWQFTSPYKHVSLLNVIPAQPVFIIETHDSYRTWKKLSQSAVWAKLKKHNFFSKIASGMDMMDTVIQGNDMLAKFIGSHDLVVSMHIMHKGTFDFLYIFDSRRISKILSAHDFI